MEIFKGRLNLGSNEELDEYTNELYNKVLNSKFYPLLVEEGWTNEIIKKNISKFNDYINDLELSTKIKTYEDCIKFNKFERVVLVQKNGFIEREYIPLRPAVERMEYISRFEVRDFDESLMKLDFRKDVLPKVKKQVLEAFKNKQWIYLTGAFRSGRTYSAIAIMNSAYAKGTNTIAFANSQKLFADLNNLYFTDKESFQNDLITYSNCDLLVLDDFGSEYKNELIRDAIVLPLLKNRIERNKMTIFTSDFDLKQIGKLYEFNKSFGLKGNNLAQMILSKVGKEIVVSTVSLY